MSINAFLQSASKHSSSYLLNALSFCTDMKQIRANLAHLVVNYNRGDMYSAVRYLTVSARSMSPGKHTLFGRKGKECGHGYYIVEQGTRRRY